MTNGDTEVRSIRPDELDALLELYKHLHSKDDPLPPGPQLCAVWETILSNPLLHCFVIERDCRLVSSCVLAIIPNLTRAARPYGLIENVVTHTDYRKRGLGAAVLKHALAISWHANCYKVMLLTGRKDPAVHRFYEAAGFRADEKTGYIARPARRETNGL
jgi:GNAT superfamily N-acetyltransferase